MILVGGIWGLDTVKISVIKGMFFLCITGTIRLFFVLYCGCIYLWLVVPDYGLDSYFCSCHIGPGSGLFFVSLLVPFCACICYTAVAVRYSICCHNKLVLWLRSFGYFANGLLYWYGFYSYLRLFIDHVICIGIRCLCRFTKKWVNRHNGRFGRRY